MNIWDEMKKKLTPERVVQLQEELGDDFDYVGDTIPKARLDRVIKDRNALRVQVSSLTPEPDPEPGAAGEDPKPDKTKVITQKDVDDAVAAAKAEAAEQVRLIQVQSAVTEKLRTAGARNPALLLPQLDLAKLVMSDDGNIDGLDDKIAAWKKDESYLFTTSNRGTGAAGKQGSDSSTLTLQDRYDEARKAGNLALAISIKNEIFEDTQKK